MDFNFPPPPPEIAAKLDELNAWRNQRVAKYGQIGSQLDMLYDDIAAGLFGEQAKAGSWFNHIKSIKDEINKPDVNAIQTEVDALINSTTE